MKFPGKEIAKTIEKGLLAEVKQLKRRKKNPHLVTILIGESEEQLSFVAIKRRLAQKLGIKFSIIHLKKVPSFEQFAVTIKKCAADPDVNAIVIQQPIPIGLQTDSLYDYIPVEKEVEKHSEKSPFVSPIGLAVLTAIKYAFKNKASIVDIKKDSPYFKRMLKNKKIVLIGRGFKAGQPIGRTLTELGINYFNINSKTYEPQQYYLDADIIITAVGKHILTKDMVKVGVILVNVGIHKEGEDLKADYDEQAMDQMARWYSTTSGGIGPLDTLYLYKNVIDATKMQSRHKK